MSTVKTLSPSGPVGQAAAATPIPRGEDLKGLLEAYLASTQTLELAQAALRSQVGALSAELEQKNALLARRNRLAELGEMAAGVAHEIRNPLGGIRLYAGLLERDLGAQPERLALVRKLLSGVDQLDRIVREMLAFTKEIVLERRPVSLEDLLEETLSFALPAGGISPIRVRREYEPGLTAQVDLHHLRRAVLNLLLNAVEAMPEGGVLTVGASRAPAGAEIRVEDSGGGIPAEVLPRIFDPFFTTKAQGTGLGLAVVQRVAEAHGGSVEASNRPGGGARFRLLLPGSPEGKA